MAGETILSSSSVIPATSDPEIETSHAEGEVKLADAMNEQQTHGTKGEGDATKANGDAEHHPDHNPSDATPTALAPGDTEMTDAGDAVHGANPSSNSAPAVTNGTPASSKKASNGSSKKKSSVIPEHKSKKLNKKKSKPLTNLEATPGEFYLARMRGHPPWPCVICDEEMLPQSLLDTRPVTTKQADGTFKKSEYADGGKRAYERTFPIMFMHTNEFAWIVNTDLTPLDPEACKDPVEKGKSKILLEAYKTASDNHDLAHFKKVLVEHQEAMQADLDARAERDAKKASKSKRKSMDATAPTDEDGMDVDEDVAEEKPKSKKRKKSLDNDVAEEKPAKTPKTGTKLKLSTPKTPTTDSASKKKTTKPKASSSKKAVAKASASDDDMIDTPKVEETPLTPAEAKQKKEKEVLYYRHKLQRGFLSRDTMPKEDEMTSMSDFLSKLEKFPDLEGSIIRATKIHKVLKAMIKLTSIPKDEDFQFKSRSHELLSKWNKILSDDPSAGGAGDKDDDTKLEATANTNGEAVEPEKQADLAEAGEAIAPEEDKKDLEKKIGTNVEGEKEAEAKKASAPETAAEAGKTDEPDVDNAAGEAYQPPAEKAIEATA